jgi:hypothetical protein
LRLPQSVGNILHGFIDGNLRRLSGGSDRVQREMARVTVVLVQLTAPAIETHAGASFSSRQVVGTHEIAGLSALRTFFAHLMPAREVMPRFWQLR